MDFAALNETIERPDETAMKQCLDSWNAVAKPIGSLGSLEETVIRMAGIFRTPKVDISKRVVLAFCADNGVVCEGVSQTGQEVTALVAENMARGCSSVCMMSKVAGASVLPVDMGMARPGAGLLDRHLMRGTNNIAAGPAMTHDCAAAALQTGIDLVGQMKQQGYRLVVTGEMGIGNTTTSAALVCALLGMEPEVAVGKGSGLSSEGMRCKVNAVRRAMEVNAPKREDALDCLAKVGGLDIAGIAGAFIGGAVHGLPVLVDGVISAVGALVATRLCPAARDYLFFTHRSAEPSFALVCEELAGKPIIDAGMRLGEGTGAVCLLPMLDMALNVYSAGTSFDGLGIDAYEVDLV